MRGITYITRTKVNITSILLLNWPYLVVLNACLPLALCLGMRPVSGALWNTGYQTIISHVQGKCLNPTYYLSSPPSTFCYEGRNTILVLCGSRAKLILVFKPSFSSCWLWNFGRKFPDSDSYLQILRISTSCYGILFWWSFGEFVTFSSWLPLTLTHIISWCPQGGNHEICKWKTAFSSLHFFPREFLVEVANMAVFGNGGEAAGRLGRLIQF